MVAPFIYIVLTGNNKPIVPVGGVIANKKKMKSREGDNKEESEEDNTYHSPFK